MIGSRRDGGTRWSAVLGLALLLGGCATGTTTSSNAFGRYTIIDGTYGSKNSLIGAKLAWQIESLVVKAPPHAVEHRVLVQVYSAQSFALGKAERETARYQYAADDTDAALKIVRIGAGNCGPGCLNHETIGIPLADETLRQRVLSGYRIRIWPRDGESELLTLSPAMIRHQLVQVDNLVQGAPPPPSAPGAPQLGIGVVAATSAPYAAAPRGVIIVVTAPQSPAAAAGIAPGDVLLAIDAQPIRVTGDIARILSGLAAKRAVTLDLERGGASFSATLQL